MRFPLLVLHISAGIIGILSGAAAISFRKGSPRHAVAGKVFVMAMLTMASSAVFLAVMKHQIGNILGGIFTFYLLATAWLAAKRGDGGVSAFGWVTLLAPLVVAAANAFSGVHKALTAAASPDGVPAGMNFFMGSVCLLAAAGDLRMLLRGGVFGVPRIIRHLWRMCFGLFIATGSFFLGQGSKVFPAFVLKSNALFVPAVLPLLLLIFWLIRVRFTNAYKRMPMPRGGDVYSLRT
jgi:uncharacterized membrane protein